MRLHLHPYPPHRDTVVDLPTTGLVVVHGANGSGKSSLVEAYAAALWGKSLRGAAAWRSEADRIDLLLSGLTVSRTPSSLLVNGETTLTTAKAQQRLTSIVGDFATWQRTRVFDADLTARFGAETDGERKKLLERLLGLEQLDAGLRKLREDLRAAEGKQTASEAQARQVRAVLAEQPLPLPGVADLGAQLTATSAALEAAERAASEMAKKEGKLAERLSRLQQDITALHAGQCPTCRQSVPGSTLRRLHEEAAEARSERIAQEAARRAAADESTALQASVRRLREVQAAAQRAAATAGRRAELETQQGIVEEEARLHGRMVSRLKQLEAFIVDARPKLLADSLAILEAAASAWIPGLQLRIIDDGLSVKLGARKYKELNEGHRRLCDLAVLLGLSGMGDAKVKGALFLDGALHGLDEDRQDAVATLLETVAQRELVIVLTCVEDVAQRLRGTRIKVANGTVT